MEARHPKKPLNVPDGQGVRLIFELTNLCNFSCTHCIRDEEGEKLYLPVALVERVLAEVQPYHTVTYVGFTGGEPTLHPQFDALVRCVTGFLGCQKATHGSATS